MRPWARAYGTCLKCKSGAYADIILVDGDPLEDVAVLADYDNNIKVVIKDGEIFKNAL